MARLSQPTQLSQKLEDVDAKGWTALHAAAMANAAAAADALLRCRADVGFKSGHLAPTALHLAAWHGHLQVIEVLLSHKADAAATNQLGELAIDKANQRGMSQAATVLGCHMDAIGLPGPARVGNAHALTARATASARAAESQRPDALFDDPLAYALAGREGRVHSDGMVWILTPRTAFGDDLAAQSYREGIRQLVLIGAGMDARAFRLKLPGMHIFEVDQQTIFDVKEPIVRDAPLTCAGRHIVPVDLSRYPLAEALVGAGFSMSKVSCWLLEGLIMYLAPDAVDSLLAQMSSLAAPGSVVFHDGVSETTQRNGVICCGAKFLSGSDDYASLWTRHGFRRSEVLDFGAIDVDRRQRCLQIHRSQSNTSPAVVKSRPMTFFVTATK